VQVKELYSLKRSRKQDIYRSAGNEIVVGHVTESHSHYSANKGVIFT